MEIKRSLRRFKLSNRVVFLENVRSFPIYRSAKLDYPPSRLSFKHLPELVSSPSIDWPIDHPDCRSTNRETRKSNDANVIFITSEIILVLQPIDLLNESNLNEGTWFFFETSVGDSNGEEAQVGKVGKKNEAELKIPWLAWSSMARWYQSRIEALFRPYFFSPYPWKFKYAKLHPRSGRWRRYYDARQGVVRLQILAPRYFFLAVPSGVSLLYRPFTMRC